MLYRKISGDVGVFNPKKFSSRRQKWAGGKRAFSSLSTFISQRNWILYRENQSKTMAELSETYACVPSTERGGGILISGDPRSNSILYCNGRSVLIRRLDRPLEVAVYTMSSRRSSGFFPVALKIFSGRRTGWGLLPPAKARASRLFALSCEFKPSSLCLRQAFMSNLIYGSSGHNWRILS